ncbi:hypothetical protein M011DRAFT_472432 [Sporormia fimetaria CBS 119925]|uniref:F-box domain-containing protein n=1 Tax=Sporormia fimetaria CBS 119925 TaxID=1340428 RepID=A0A6A6UYX0_9PLEO|nr:hypothetical protein M011DRAFT_472432 [Sporormia fimetaria CBS 119925]
MATSETPVQDPQPQPQLRLLCLPLELIIEIVRNLADDKQSLLHLAMTCRELHPLAEEQLYNTIELQDTGSLKAICYAFSKRPRRVEFVQTLRMVYRYERNLSQTFEDRQLLNRCIKDMKALREWRIESPFDNYKWREDDGAARWVEDDMEVFREALEAASLHQGRRRDEDVGLSRLRRLTIHSHGTDVDFWDLNGYRCLFRHPTLQYLHVSCMSFPSAIPELENFVSTTPLQTLIFDECELTPGSLYNILGTPKALEELTLGENVANFRERVFDPRLTPAAEHSLRALKRVAHSLRKLVHLDPSDLFPNRNHVVAVPFLGDGMREFDHLTTLDCPPCSFLYRGIIRRPHMCPRNLKTLRIRHYQHHHNHSFFDELPDCAHLLGMSSLRRVDFLEPLLLSASVLPARVNHICERTALKERHRLAYLFWKKGIDMRLYAETQGLGRSYVPPFLFSEPLPKLVCVYDAPAIGFKRAPGADVLMFTADLERAQAPSTLGAMLDHDAAQAQVVRGLWRQNIATPGAAPVETDALSDEDIECIKSCVHRALSGFRWFGRECRQWQSNQDHLPWTTTDLVHVHQYGDGSNFAVVHSDDSLSDDDSLIALHADDLYILGSDPGTDSDPGAHETEDDEGHDMDHDNDAEMIIDEGEDRADSNAESEVSLD